MNASTIVRVFVLGILLTVPARATMILLSEARSVFVSYSGNGTSETRSSDGNFGLFDQTVIGTPYGGGWVEVHQRSILTPTLISVDNYAYDFYGPGAVGRSDFQVRFTLTEPTYFTVSAGTWNIPGLASIVSDTRGTIPVQWPYGGGGVVNTGSLTLAADTYTFTERIFYGDSIHTSYELRVPDGGASAWLLAIGVLSLVAIRRRLA